MKVREHKVYDRRLLAFLWRIIHPHQRYFWLSTALLPIISAIALAQPWLMKVEIDLFLARRLEAPPWWLAPLLPGSAAGGVLVIGGLIVLLMIVEFAALYAQSYLAMKLAHYSLADFRVEIFAHVQQMSAAFFDQNQVGQLLSRMVSDVDAIGEIFGVGALTILLDVLNLAAIAAILIALDLRLGLWSTAALLPLAISVRFFVGSIRAAYRVIRERVAALNGFLSEAIGGVTIIQLFTRERQTCGEFEQLNLAARDAQVSSAQYEAGMFSSIEVVRALVSAIILWIGGGEVVRGAIGLGTVVAFFEYLRRFFAPLNEISNKYSVLQSALAAVERTADLMELPPAITSPRNGYRVRRPQPGVVFDKVNFAYRPGEAVLRDLSFEIKPGERVALVGPTGAGKSTIIKLLTRFYDVTGGRILIDGVDVREWDLGALRNVVGIVQQEVFLASGSILDNLWSGEGLPDENKVREALARVQALHFIERLPGGLSEQLRERGANLSAGQRQLLSLARTVLYDSGILVLDEATSGIDSQTERVLQQALEEVMANRTALVIAHRLSTIVKANRILVLGHGELRESGTHQELLAHKGLYYKLYQLQFAPPESAVRTAAAG